MTKTSSDLINDYKKIEEIVAQNPDITAEEFGEKLKDTEIGVNYATVKCYTLLYWAVYHFTKEHSDKESILTIIKLLLINDADINIGYQDEKNRIFVSPVNLSVIASLKGHTDLLKVFLESKAVNCSVMQGALEFVTNLDEHEEMTHRQEVIALLKSAMKEEQGMPNTERSNNGNTGSKLMEEVAPTVIATPSDDDSRPAILEPSEQKEVNTEAHNQFVESHEPVKEPDILTYTQFSIEDKYKESKKDFYISLSKDFVGIFVTGLLITGAIFVPLPGAIVLGALAILTAIVTGLHMQDSTRPSYKKMQENEVERINRNSKPPTTCAAFG